MLLNCSYSHFHGQHISHSVLLEVRLQFEGGDYSRTAFNAKCLLSRTSQKSSIKSSTLSLANSLDWFRP